MKRYEILEHKADLKIRAFGKTKKELFENMLFGMSQSQKAEVERGEKTKREIKTKSSDNSSLLVDFLNEVLYSAQVNKEIYLDLEFEKISDTELEAKLLGQRVARLGEEVKAATYHDLSIRRLINGTWEATILFDL